MAPSRRPAPIYCRQPLVLTDCSTQCRPHEPRRHCSNPRPRGPQANDQPGLLAKVSTVIGESGGNIIEVNHNRLALDVPAKGAEFDITIETRDARHTQEIIDALTKAGFPPRPHT